MAAKTLADFPISQHRQPRNPEIIQLDSFPTANGVKASITLEEPGLPHDAHLVPADPALRIETIQWLMFQMGDIGAMFGQYGHFGVFAGKDIEDPRPRERDENEAKRLPSVHEQRLEGRRWIMGDD